MEFKGYNKDNRKEAKAYAPLPKGNYVCKIMSIEETKYSSGKKGLKIYFDIAEGDYKDFYTNKYQESDKEDKKWNFDAIFYLTVPEDGAEAYIQDNWDTFWANLEDSNNGYVFTGDEKTIKGKVIGGIFRIEQTEYNGRTYNHTKLFKTAIAQDVRDGKIDWIPDDKLLPNQPAAPTTDDNGFINVPAEAVEMDLPFK